jgi:quinol monooxygenase YgiN
MNIIIKRKLKDYDAWKKIVSELDGLRKQYGSKGMTAYRSAKDPNEVYLIFEWEDEKRYRAYLDLPEVSQALADTGSMEVIEVSESFHLEE